MLSLFRKKGEKWHEVRWRNGPRRIYLALRFAATEPAAPPEVEKLPPAEGSGDAKADPSLIVREVESAVAEYNRMNHCALRVAAIRYRSNESADHVDHGTATRKLLNLL